MKKLVIALALCSFAVHMVRGDNWPNWRGPHFNGVAVGQGFPTTWSTTEGILWKATLPGKGSSTPIVWNKQIFLTCGVNEQNTVVSFDRKGEILWQTNVGTARAGKHKKATGCNPSPATDGERVYVYFKSGDLACLDFNGKVLWSQNLQKLYGEDTLWWDLGTSPVLTKDNVVIAVMQTGPSYLVAFDKKSGEVAWKEDRTLDAPQEAAQSYSTPLVLNHAGRELLAVLGADHVTAHDAATGKELWRVGGLNPTGQKFFRSISSPVFCDGIIVAPYARGNTLTAIRLGTSTDPSEHELIWTRDKLGADVPTPAAKDGKLYLLTDKGGLECLDIKTGNTMWSGQLEKNRNGFSSSPILADGKIYMTREDGKTFVAEQGDEFKLLGSNELTDELMVATPVFIDGQILLRTAEHLYCISK